MATQQTSFEPGLAVSTVFDKVRPLQARALPVEDERGGHRRGDEQREDRGCELASVEEHRGSAR